MKLYIVLLLALVMFMRPSMTTGLPEAELVIEGILVGSFGEVGHDVKTCIKDGGVIFDDIRDAITQFKLKTKEGIVNGLKLIGEAIALIPEEVKDCEEIYQIVKDLEEIAAEFADPEAFLILVGERILWHGISIVEDVEGSIQHFENDQYEPAGEDIGDIIYIIFLSSPKGDKIEDAVQFLEGFFKGALEDDSVELEGCIDDADQIIKSIELIVADFEKGVTSDLEKLFMDLLDLMSDIPKTVIKCGVAEHEIEIIEQWALEMKDLTLMEHKLFDAFLEYPSRIKEDFKTLIDSFKASDFNKSGFGLGDILHVLFVNINQGFKETDFDDIVEFTKGFYAKAFDIKLDLDTCDADVDAAWDALVKAVDEIKEFTVAGIEQGIEDLIMALPKFVESFKVCEADWPDLERGLEKLKVFEENPLYVPWAVTKASTLHPIRMTEDSTELYHAFHDLPRNFEHGGEASGDIVGLVVSEMGKVDSVVQAALKN
eukprot:CAMPEP_0168337340 /NCGR_PEP_ID=MMETSP0213-20121227/12115_1 /TAXON_ID=151035 /ORGANISM="Euplotes harpa, Strain FSP1.4" /LENGTH=485 /DNA_ID=CAMNT_0008342777 /DNA_START=31 /DNA_END=1488 /DNA_ORIENTATION=+